jgi:hypothetical protein
MEDIENDMIATCLKSFAGDEGNLHMASVVLIRKLVDLNLLCTGRTAGAVLEAVKPLLSDTNATHQGGVPVNVPPNLGQPNVPTNATHQGGVPVNVPPNLGQPNVPDTMEAHA